MKHNTVANGIIASIILAFITAFFVTDYATSDTLYAISGFGMMFFGIWGAIKLKKITE
jgi:hypothetical protein